mmetsp:Transcript_2561/g.9945  ORF Transcript_2561/g.9945 Transcript_2561/m.9945 type:complete len:144 (+) Transcript_2561:1403-1834(+)
MSAADGLKLVVIVKIIFVSIITRHVFSLLVDLRNDRIANCFYLLKLLFIFLFFCVLVVIQPIERFFDSLFHCELVFARKFIRQLVVVPHRVFHVVGVGLKAIPGINALLDFSVFLGKLLSFFDHPLDFLLRQATFIVGDCDLF